MKMYAIDAMSQKKPVEPSIISGFENSTCGLENQRYCENLWCFIKRSEYYFKGCSFNFAPRTQTIRLQTSK